MRGGRAGVAQQHAVRSEAGYLVGEATVIPAVGVVVNQAYRVAGIEQRPADEHQPQGESGTRGPRDWR